MPIDFEFQQGLFFILTNFQTYHTHIQGGCGTVSPALSSHKLDLTLIIICFVHGLVILREAKNYSLTQIMARFAVLVSWYKGLPGFFSYFQPGFVS